MTRFCLALLVFSLAGGAAVAATAPVPGAATGGVATSDTAPNHQSIRFRIVNRTHLTIAMLSLTPAAPNAEPPQQPLPPDESAAIATHSEIAPDTVRTVHLPPGPTCRYAILATFVTSAERQLGTFDLCSGSPVVLLPLPSDDQQAEHPLPAGPVPAGAPLPQQTRARVGVAGLLMRGAQPASLDGVYGVLLLQRDSPRNLLVCRDFFTEFVAMRDVTLSPGDAVRRPTYWPDTRKTSGMPRTTSCTDLLAHYDWESAGGQLSLHGLLEGSGPYLVIYGACGQDSSGRLSTAALDLSGYPDSELSRAFRIWADILTGDPTTWCGTKYVQHPREAFRNFLLTYSDVFVSFLVTRAEAADHGLLSATNSPTGALAIKDDVIQFQP
jgi:hypothetical protein